jgi:hypothetical protein
MVVVTLVNVLWRCERAERDRDGERQLEHTAGTTAHYDAHYCVPLLHRQIRRSK